MKSSVIMGLSMVILALPVMHCVSVLQDMKYVVGMYV